MYLHPSPHLPDTVCYFENVKRKLDALVLLFYYHTFGARSEHVALQDERHHAVKLFIPLFGGYLRINLILRFIPTNCTFCGNSDFFTVV